MITCLEFYSNVINEKVEHTKKKKQTITLALATRKTKQKQQNYRKTLQFRTLQSSTTN